MSYNPQNPNGQATSANSEPVVIASDQSAVPVSGSVTANAGTNLNTSALSTTANQTNGNQKTQVVDGSGNVIGSTANALNVNIAGGSVSGSSNLTEIDGSSIVTAGVAGTLATGGNQAAGSNISSNTNPLPVGGSDYGGTAKLQVLKVDASGNAQVAVTNTPSVSISGTPTVTANAGTNLNTSALALDTSVNGLLAGQGSTTAGQKGTLDQGAVTTAAPTYTSGQTSPLSLDTSGNLRTSVNNTVTVSGSITTTPPSNASTNIAQIGGSAIALGNTTMSASVPVTLASNDTNTVPFVTAGGGGYVRQDSTGTIAKESGGNLATLAGAVSGGKVNVNLSAGSNTIGNVEITDGTNTANVMAPGTALSTGNAELVGGTTDTITFSTTTAQAVAVTDAGNYAWVSITITSEGTGSINTVQVSNDNATWSSMSLVTTGTSQGNYTATVDTAGVTWSGPLTGRYFRINVTGISTGTTAGTVVFSTMPRINTFLQVGSGSATGSAVPSNAFYMGANSGTSLAGLQTASAQTDASTGTAALSTAPYLFNGSSFDRIREATSISGTTGTGLLGAGVMGIYNSSTQTATSGNYYPLQLDVNENLKVNVAAGSGLTVEPGNTPNTTPWLMSLQPATSGGWSVSSQTALTNTIVYAKTSAGQFGGYMFNNPNAAVMYIQIFNAASGATLGTTAPTYVIPIPAAASANIEFANGIAHSAGIGLAATTTATGNSAPTTALTGFIVYK